jgi:hypothetical protein
VTAQHFDETALPPSMIRLQKLLRSQAKRVLLGGSAKSYTFPPTLFMERKKEGMNIIFVRQELHTPNPNFRFIETGTFSFQL